MQWIARVRPWLVTVSALLACLSTACAGEEGQEGPGDNQAADEVTASHAWYCGDKCDGKSPHWVVPSKGVECSKSAVLVHEGHPSAAQAKSAGEKRAFNDPDITVKVYYSTTCQTLWGVVSNKGEHVTGERECEVRVGELETGGARLEYTCPASGKTLTTAMVNDHSPSSGKFAFVGTFVTHGSGSHSSYSTFLYDY